MSSPQEDLAWMRPSDAETSSDNVERRRIESGFRYTNAMMGAVAAKEFENAVNVFSLIEILVARGVVGVAELDERRKLVTQQLSDSPQRKNEPGFLLRSDGQDKYQTPHAVEINCAERHHLCHAACCHMHFAVSPQDIDEGVVRWDLGRPYAILQDSDGACVHKDKATHRCSVHAHRPLTCREYDCRRDDRVWTDFDNMIPNPNLPKLLSRAAAETAGEDDPAGRADIIA